MTLPPSILFANESRTVVLLDLPRSIEEAQLLPGELRSGSVPPRRLVSANPPETPFPTPEPKSGQLDQYSSTPSAQVAGIMTLAAVNDALGQVQHTYRGPYCLPRIISGPEERSKDSPAGGKRKFSSAEDGQKAPAEPTAGQVYTPEQAHYLLGSIRSQRATFLSGDTLFKLMVIDPPWPNRSARRKKDNYATATGLAEIKHLLSLVPVPSRLSPDGLVAVWVTNAPRFAELLTAPGGIFSRWGLELVSEWTWLKVTTKGEPVYHVESAWRKPWERLLIARRVGSARRMPGPTKVIITVPDVHSRKPNLRGLFDDVFEPGYPGLEIFARNLTAGWWSWGDETLRFQRRDCWVDVERPHTPSSHQ